MNRRVMVVDDEPNICRALNRLLTAISNPCPANIETVTAVDSGPVAHYQLRSASFQYFVPAIVACRARPDSVIE